MSEKFDIVIIGAGPSGSTCALALEQSGLKVALIDKATFPRDKICGDAIPGPAFKALNKIAPNLTNQAFQFHQAQNVKSSKIVAPDGTSFQIDWVTKAYNCKRIDFDFQLLNLVKTQTGTEVFEETQIISIKQTKGIFQIKSPSKSFSAKLIIGADGANGICAKSLTNFSLNRNHHCAAVRAYFKNVKGIESTTNEFFLLKKYVPGYFWIFPLRDSFVNVGFGMLSKEISKRKINLAKTLLEIIETNPYLKDRFEMVDLVGKIQGFGLPLGSRIANISGDGFMLLGDAGSLIDPLQGHGIDKGMWSGIFAAEQAMDCFNLDRFDADFMQFFERRVYKKFEKEFKRNYLMMKTLGKFPYLLNGLTALSKIPGFNPIIKRFT